MLQSIDKHSEYEDKGMQFRTNPSRLLALITIVALAWSSSLTGEFTGYDDIKLIVDNEHASQGILHSLGFFWDTFSGSFNTAWSDYPTIIYRPLEQYAIALGQKLWGTSAWHYHFFFNFLLHILNSLLVFFILKKFIKQELLALCICAIWAVHPLHHEAVNMLTSGAGFLLAHSLGFTAALIMLYKNNLKWLALASVLFFIALLGSEMIVLLLPILAILIHKQERYSIKLWGLGSALIAYLIKRSSIVSSNLEMNSFELFERIFVLAPQILVNYFTQYLFPNELTIDLQHKLWIENAFTPLHFGSMLLVLVIIAMILFFNHRGDKTLAASLSITIIGISVALNITPLYSLARDRYTYIFSLGLTVFILLLATKVINERIIFTISAVLILILGTRSWLKNLDWRNGERLWTQTINLTDDIGAKQVWRYRLLQYYDNPGTDSFIPDPEIKKQVLNDFASFVIRHNLHKQGQIQKYDQKINSIKNKYSYNEARSIASGIFSYAMYLKHQGRYKDMLPLLELAYFYHPEHFQNNLQLFVWVPSYKEKVREKLYRDAISHPIFAKSLLDSLYILKDEYYQDYALQLANIYPNSKIFQRHLELSEGLTSAKLP